MSTGFFNGTGALFVINFLAWMQSLAVALVIFGVVYGFVMAFKSMFRLH